MAKKLWKRNFIPVLGERNTWRNEIPLQFPKTPHEEAIPSTTLEPRQEQVVSQQTENFDADEVFYPVVVASIGLVLILIVLIGIIIWSKRRNKHDEEKPQASSILIYPYQQGTPPQFLFEESDLFGLLNFLLKFVQIYCTFRTKEIHFSLPPLRSTSLGDLNESDHDDSDMETESLLLPTTHNQRSNSFSCYGLGVIEPSLYKSTLDLDEIQWPEGHIGRLWFSLRYEPSTEKLLVSLLKAKNLPSRTIGTVNSCDPFVRLHLMPDERRYLQSKPKKKTCNPYFDETLVFQVSAKDMSDHILKLTLIDGGRPKRKWEIGHVTYPLKELEIGDGSEQQLFKMDLEKEVQEIKSNLGELLVSLVYNENLNRLTATIIEARGLKVS
ncbi:synaptotagmin [Holotrichia oblita]|uniref:Synaptotagmin n=1 Tax=Holotrichia oblita TaxID=644536 RepID=A0ACB9SML3_HOLOL|nr:synaptotagmin [Holotrichia oblita]